MDFFDFLYPLPVSGVITLIVFVTAGIIAGIFRLVSKLLLKKQTPLPENQNFSPDNNCISGSKEIHLKYYIVDTFTDVLFQGNSAGVCILENQLNDILLQNIAAKNNLAETAFVTKDNDQYVLRLFTPKTEIDTCANATLASAFIITHFIDTDRNALLLNAKSGTITVKYDRNNELYTMDFPNTDKEKISGKAMLYMEGEIRI